MVEKFKMLSMFHYNELCERFSHCGLRSILYIFLRSQYKFKSRQAHLAVHLMWAFQYTVPLVAGTVVEVIWGDIPTVLVFGMIYLASSLLLTFSSLSMDNSKFLWPILFLMSFSLGSIKPAVILSFTDTSSSFKPLSRTFRGIAFAVYVSSFLSVLWAPLLVDLSCLGKNTCYPLTFGLSSLLIFLVMCLFLSTKKHFVALRPPTKIYRNLLDFLKIWLTDSSPAHIPDGLEMNYSEFIVLIDLFKGLWPIAIFWMLYDQQYSSWIEQTLNMNTLNLSFIKDLPDETNIVNNLLMLIFIPLIAVIFYPILQIVCKQASPLHKLIFAVGISSLSYFISAYVQYKIETENRLVEFFWQIPQFLIMTSSELLINMCEMKFLYCDCPESMRGIAALLWLFLVGISNLLLALFGFIDPIRRLLRTRSFIPVYIFFGLLGAYASFLLSKYQTRKSCT